MSKQKRIILILSLIVFVGCVGYLAKYFYDCNKANEEFNELQELVGNEEEPQEENTAEEVNEVEEKPVEAYADNGMIQGYYEAYVKNNDMVGWVRIPDTRINYPVMQTSDNDFYMNKNFEKKYQYSGTPFVDYQCDVSKPSDNIVIYAHNMRDGSMFAALTDYADKSFFDKHPTIYFDTNYQRGKYQIFAVITTKVGGKDEFMYNHKIDFSNAEDFMEYMSIAKKNSLYSTGVSVNYGDKILMLSTCSYNRSNERMVVMAKKVE